MNELPSITLLQQSHAAPKSGEELETLGKHAAKSFASGNHETLSNAVVETVKRAGLSPEQVRRVIEFANVAAYQEEFDKEGGSTKYVDFQGGPADPGTVLKDLNDGGGGTVFDKGRADYALDPPAKAASCEDSEDLLKTASCEPTNYPLVFSPGETALREAFSVEEREYPFADPLEDARSMKEKIGGAADHLTHELSGLEADLHESMSTLYHEVKQASLSGVDLGQVLVAWQEAVPGAEYVKTAFSFIGPRLVEDGVFRGLDEVGESLEKTAHSGLVNQSHPLVKAMSGYCTVLEKLATTRAARDELIQERNRLDGFLRKAAALVPRIVRGARQAGELAERGTRFAGRHVLGEGPATEAAARAAKGLVGYSPEIAAGAGGVLTAQELHDRAKYGPIGRRVLSRIPGTQASQMRKMQLMHGGR